MGYRFWGFFFNAPLPSLILRHLFFFCRGCPSHGPSFCLSPTSPRWSRRRIPRPCWTCWITTMLQIKNNRNRRWNIWPTLNRPVSDSWVLRGIGQRGGCMWKRGVQNIQCFISNWLKFTKKKFYLILSDSEILHSLLRRKKIQFFLFHIEG